MTSASLEKRLNSHSWKRDSQGATTEAPTSSILATFPTKHWGLLDACIGFTNT